jgi:hypothetical protein
MSVTFQNASGQLTYAQLSDLCGGRLGTFDVPCPVCGPDRNARANQKRDVFRIYHQEPGFATYNCARCEAKGYARDESLKTEPRRLPRAGETTSPRVIVPLKFEVIDEALLDAAIDRHAPAGYEITKYWPYPDAGGSIIFAAARYDGDGDKTFRPFISRNGEIVCCNFADKRPLYGLDRLAARPGDPVLVVEGEKTADAAGGIFPGYVVVTSSGGSKAANKADWSPLVGRQVTIWPDNDDPGHAYARDVSRLVAKAKIVNLPDSIPDGWDLADPEIDELDLASILLGADQPEKEKDPNDWRSHVVTAGALQYMTFPEPCYIVNEIIPEGLSILAGRPKIGKSWMALDVALGIASGLPVLGGIRVQQGDVLYCCLEDNHRRLKRRITKLLSAFGGKWPERLTLATKWRRLDKGGVADLEAWCDSVESPRLIILDTLAGVRPIRSGNDTLYEGDYAALRDVHRLANDRAIGAVALHHTRKMEADDPVDTISGSLGLAGAADTCLILARTSSGTTLYVRGRDIEEGEKAVIFGSANCKWSLLGDAAAVQRSDSRTKILDAMDAATDVLTPAEVAAATSLQRNNVDQLLHQMVLAGEVVKVRRGEYAAPDKEFAIPPKKPKD